MIGYQQKEIIKKFVKNILNSSLDNKKQVPRDIEKGKLYYKLLNNSKNNPYVNELVNDYLSNINKRNNNIDIELSYIIQILALLNYSFDSIHNDKY